MSCLLILTSELFQESGSTLWHVFFKPLKPKRPTQYNQVESKTAKPKQKWCLLWRMEGPKRLLNLTLWAMASLHWMSFWCINRRVRNTKLSFLWSQKLQDMRLRCRNFSRVSLTKISLIRSWLRDLSRRSGVATSTRLPVFPLKFHDLMLSLPILERSNNREARRVIVPDMSCTPYLKKRRARSSGC